MAEKSALFAFVAGEVAPAFHGRADLSKHNLAVAEAENFYIDYKGGLFTRPGTAFVGALPANQQTKLFRFRASTDDYLLIFTPNLMRIVRNGGFLLVPSGTETATFVGGSATVTEFYVVGGMVYLQDWGYAYITGFGLGTLILADMFGDPIEGTHTITRVYDVVTTLTNPNAWSYSQDVNDVIITSENADTRKLTYISDTNWSFSTLVENVPPAPTGLAVVPSGAGTASVIYAVTAVVNGIESNRSPRVGIGNIVNFTTTTGHTTLSWSAVAGAEYYNVYRTVVYPVAYTDTLDTLGYIGRTEGITYMDANRTPDFTKTPPRRIDFFAGGNFPALYSRFQQRGVYAGLKNDPLSVVGANRAEQATFRANSPPIADDAFKYTIDAESTRPIKHMLPLTYGLLLFTDDTIAQLRGGSDSKALTAVSAFAETQSYTSVADVRPVAVNLDVLYFTSLYSEFNAMLYTNYTNSFETQDIMVLSSHLFGPEAPAIALDWAPEPHKLLHMVREDGQRITLTYERKQEVFGWARHRTKGEYRTMAVIRENNYNVPYYLTRRVLHGVEMLCVEQERPRLSDSFRNSWYVDCGIARQLTVSPRSGTLTKVGDLEWELHMNLPLAVPGDSTYGAYIHGGYFLITGNSGTTLSLAAMSEPKLDEYYNGQSLKVKANSWEYAELITTITGLHHLENETISVMADGNAYTDLTVVNGSVALTNPACYIVAGLGYRCRVKTLPLRLSNGLIEGMPNAPRPVAMRLLETKGLSVGPSYDDMEMLPTRTDEPWGAPLQTHTELLVKDFLGGSGWELDSHICFEQTNPLPAAILGIVYNLDIGED